MKTLYLEKRGCDYFENDSINLFSDVGNHRLCTLDYEIQGIDGNTYFIEFSHWDYRVFRKVNYKTGKALKNPKLETIKHNAICMRTQFKDSNGNTWGNWKLDRIPLSADIRYTLSGILAAVNMISAVKYDRVELIDCLPF